MLENLKINKGYIGQSVNPRIRWNQHIYESRQEYPSMVINRAMKKHCFTDGYFDPAKCSFEVLACSITQEDADYIEDVLINQHNTHIKNKMGYNVSMGGATSPKTDEWKQKLSNWHKSLSPEEKEQRSKKLSRSFKKYIEINGHPVLGTKRTPEQIKKIQDNRTPVVYTPELRQKLSETHIGLKDTEEAKINKSNSAKAAWDKRIEEATLSGELKCNAPGCEIKGQASYLIVNDIRYCSKHGQRLKNTGFLELQPHSSHNKGKKTPEEVLVKLRGRTPHNKRFFTEEELIKILDQTISIKQTAKDFGVTDKVIARIRKEHQIIK